MHTMCFVLMLQSVMLQAASGQCLWALSGAPVNQCGVYWALAAVASTATFLSAMFTAVLTTGNLVRPDTDLLASSQRCE